MLTQERLQELLHYCADTGVFTWKVNRSRNAKKGYIAGHTKNKDGYHRIYICRKSYLAHRLAFLYVDGDFPPEHTDHINHSRADNRFCNLRKVTRKENLKNISHRPSASGIMGVCWHKQHEKWQANISHNGKLKHLGYFENKHKAIAVRKAAEVMYGYHPNHGRKI